MNELIAIPGSTKYCFCTKEVAFIAGITQAKAKHFLHKPDTAFEDSFTVDQINEGLLHLTTTPDTERFNKMLNQINLRLIQHMRELKVERKLQSGGYKYPSIHAGAISLIRVFSSPEQKQRVCLTMERSKFDPMWGIKVRDAWINELKETLGLLAL